MTPGFPAAVTLLIVFNQAQTRPPARYSLSVDCATVSDAEARSSGMAEFKKGEAAILGAKWPEAESALLKAVALDPLLAAGHYGRGQTYMSQKRFQEAVHAFPTSRQTYGCVPWSDDDRRRRTEEIRDLRDALRIADRRRLQELGVRWKEVNGDVRTPGDKMRAVHEAQRRLEELEASVSETYLAPPEVTLALGTALFQIDRLPEAEVEFRAVLARDPKSGDARHNLALVLTITDRLEEAEREIAATEKSGVPIHPRLRQELERRKALKPR